MSTRRFKYRFDFRSFVACLILFETAQLAAHGEVMTYPAPAGSTLSKDYTVTVDAKRLDIYSVPTNYNLPASFAYCDFNGRVSVSVTVDFLLDDKIKEATVHPLALGIVPVRKGNCFTFELARPSTITVLVNGAHQTRPLHLFFSPPVEPAPENAIVFGPGRHTPGNDKPIVLKDKQTVYLAGGAWVEGVIRANGAKNIRVLGRGVLCQSVPNGKDYTGKESGAAGVVLVDCQDVTINGIIETRTLTGWCGLAMNCDRVTLRNYHVLAPVVWSTDGFNPCNSRDLTLEDCFIRSGDDCISIKGNTGGDVLKEPHIPPATQPACENITVSNCTLWSDWNNVIAIGCESRAKYMKNLKFKNCDVLYHVKYSNDTCGVISIIPLHGTPISNITFDDIRVEHCENKLFCFHFLDNIYGIPGDQSFPGGISAVTIRNISVRHQLNGPLSEFSGYATDKTISDVTIEAVRYGEKLVNSAAEMGLKCNNFVTGVRFIAPAGKK